MEVVGSRAKHREERDMMMHSVLLQQWDLTGKVDAAASVRGIVRVTSGIEEVWERDKSRYGDMCPRRERFVCLVFLVKNKMKNAPLFRHFFGKEKNREKQWRGGGARREKS